MPKSMVGLVYINQIAIKRSYALLSGQKAMATLKSRLNKLEGRQATTSKQSIVVFPWETEASVMAASGLSADEVNQFWHIEFVEPGCRNLIAGREQDE